jgi:hypothetical protein
VVLQVVGYLIGHFPVHQWRAPGDLSGIERLAQGRNGQMPETEEVRRRLGEGDVYLHLGYYSPPTEAYAVAISAGATVVEVLASGSGRSEVVSAADGNDVKAIESPPEVDFSIDPGWPWGDGLVVLEGYDVDVLPSSGFGSATCYWMLAGGMHSLADAATRAML